jgi:hypothetical protein
MKIDKRGALGGLDMVGMIYRVLLICIISVGIFGLFAISYEYYVDVRDAEAIILAREVSSCLVEGGVLRLEDFDDEKDVLRYCGFGEDGRFYVGVDVLDGSGVLLVRLESGDSSALWVRDLFDKVDEISGRGEGVADNVENIVKSNPGYYLLEHEVVVLNDGETKMGKVEVEVLVRSEDE